MKKISYKNTIILSVIGFILSVIFFFNSSTILKYFTGVLISVFVFGSIGWSIDRFKPKKIVTILLILLYISLFFSYVLVERSYGHCQSFNFVMVENIFTGECKCITIACYLNPPWYLKEHNTCEKIGICDLKGKS